MVGNVYVSGSENHRIEKFAPMRLRALAGRGAR
jgi:hypothetical protein